jgi:hypothetical protein
VWVNAWLISESGTEARVWLTSTRDEVVISPKQDGTDTGSGTAGAEVIKRMPGKVEAVNLDTDVEALLKWLPQQIAKQRAERMTNRYYRGEADPAENGLTLAAIMHRMGHAEKAHALAAAKVGEASRTDLSRMIASTMGGRANARYQSALEKLCRDGDWAAFRDSLRELTTTFARGWDRRDAVRVLPRHVEERAAKKDSLLRPARPLSAQESEKLNQWLALLQEGRIQMPYAVWIFPPAPDSDEQQSETVGAEDILTREGAAMVEPLIALLADDTLTTYAPGLEHEMHPLMYRRV